MRSSSESRDSQYPKRAGARGRHPAETTAKGCLLLVLQDLVLLNICLAVLVAEAWVGLAAALAAGRVDSVLIVELGLKRVH
jgi:hypothetical protein